MRHVGFFLFMLLFYNAVNYSGCGVGV